MKEAARTTGIVLFAIAVAALATGLFVPLQSGEGKVSGASVVASEGFVFTELGGSDAASSKDDSTTWWSSEVSGVDGVGLVRAAAPTVGAGVLFLAAALVLLILHRRLVAGILGAVGSAAAVTGAVLGLVGLQQYLEATSIPQGLSFSYAWGFYVAVCGLLAAVAGTVFAFVAVAEAQDGGPARANLPKRPAISVEDPYAFNPLASSTEARPFKPDPPQELRGFEVTGGNRPFRADPKPEPKPEPTKPAAKPAQRPAPPKPGA